jgi:hypothetical protein
MAMTFTEECDVLFYQSPESYYLLTIPFNQRYWDKCYTQLKQFMEDYLERDPPEKPSDAA